MAQLNHIGIAVSDLPRVKKLFEILGLKTGHEEVVADQGVKTTFMPMDGSKSNIELLEPLKAGEGPIGQALAKRGPGIHHMSFLVGKGELEPLCTRLQSEGFKMTYDAPKAGAHNMRVNFIHPSTTGGMLIEVMEPA